MDGHDERYSLFLPMEMRLKTTNQMWSQLPSEATAALNPKYFPVSLESPLDWSIKRTQTATKKSTIPDRETVGE